MRAHNVLVAWPRVSCSSSSSSSSLSSSSSSSSAFSSSSSSSSSVSLVVRLPPVACVWQIMFTGCEEALAFSLAARPHALRCPNAPSDDTLFLASVRHATLLGFGRARLENRILLGGSLVASTRRVEKRPPREFRGYSDKTTAGCDLMMNASPHTRSDRVRWRRFPRAPITG